MAFGSVERFVAKNEIEALFHRYAVLATEEPDIEKMATVFEEGGVFRLPNGVIVKPRNLLEVVRGNNPKFIRHHVTSIDIQFVSPTEAHTRSYFLVTTDVSSVDHWGQWRDVVRKGSNGQWLIADRSVVVEGGDQKGWFRTTYAE
ncbi:uncharacterized protein A1O5_06511 [Cladophialophora psammophila CBS 110553]|uniref:SnoaL-like domain-containing protein n=1 Tax=Cladophialophora psammophila CBS 110553 TaxID=1182543 RepID=W9WRA6_9EURO|nr:uncharacterized protein A1O5_06511 [Cladophialophora psammophila CBS 110553]EXJ70443.1 hypothetical protein A1O5_06511 [Cladophialophora psammophila CBS 110553]